MKVYQRLILVVFLTLDIFNGTTQSTKDSVQQLNHGVRILRTDTNEKKNWFERPPNNLTSLIGFFILAITYTITFNQWRMAEKWKRHEATMNRVESFHVTPGAHNAIMMIDSPDRNIPLWDNAKPEERYVRVLRKEVTIALLPNSLLAYSYSSKESAIRDSFNDFLGRIKHIRAYQKKNLLKDQDIELIIGYSLKDIKESLKSDNEDDQLFVKTLIVYITDRAIPSVIEVFEHFGIEVRSRSVEYTQELSKKMREENWVRAPE